MLAETQESIPEKAKKLLGHFHQWLMDDELKGVIWSRRRISCETPMQGLRSRNQGFQQRKDRDRLERETNDLLNLF